MKRVILAIVIILLILLGAYYLFGPEGLLVSSSDNATTTPEMISETENKTTYVASGEVAVPAGYKTFRRLGIALNYPADITPTEQPIAGTPDVLAVFGEDLTINYTNKASEWAAANIPNYTFIGTQVFGDKVFTVYQDEIGLLYWITNGDNGYEFRVLSNRIDLSTLTFH